MNVLVINSGSSSLKFQIIEMPRERVLAKGIVERLGEPQSELHYQKGQISVHREAPFKDHAEGLKAVIALLTDEELGILQKLEDIHVVGHRVVHGGEAYDAPTKIDDAVLQSIKRLSALAPLHNPANATGIEISQSLFPSATQVAIFDTAFHQTIPKKAYTYAIPKKITEQYHIRAYGFHGTSHKYVSEKAIAQLGKADSKIITMHLGNGCSITAVKNGKSVEHSLGFGPSNGLIMGTRSGDIDQSVIFFLMDAYGMDSGEINTMLQKESGLLGLTGHADLRDIQKKAEQGDKNCQLALQMVAHRIKKYIGAYSSVLNGLDALVFTAGIGENSSLLRKMVCTEMSYFGIYLDDTKNASIDHTHDVSEIQAPDSAIRIMVIRTNEELEIARQAVALQSKETNP